MRVVDVRKEREGGGLGVQFFFSAGEFGDSGKEGSGKGGWEIGSMEIGNGRVSNDVI